MNIAEGVCAPSEGWNPMTVREVTEFFKTLSDPTRLRLLRLMAESELSEVTQLAQSRVSNHLKRLREEGLLQERPDGPWRNYRVDADRLPPAARALWDGIRAAWDGDEQFAPDLARLGDVLARRSERSGRFFETFADQWDGIRADLFGDSIGRAILRGFVPPDLVVADIGAGTGYALELFGSRPRRILAIDNSEAMLSVARRKVEALGLSNVEFRLGDAHDPPLETGEAGLVVFAMVLQHLEDPARAVAAAASRLAPGGRLFVADFLRHQETWLRETMRHRWLGFERAQLEAWLRAAGCRVDAWSILPGRPWTAPDGRRVRIPDGFALVAGQTHETNTQPITGAPTP